MSPPDLFRLLLAVTTYSCFALGVWTVFDRRTQATLGLRLIKACAPLAAALELWALATTLDAPPWREAVGSLLFVVSLGLFLWSAATTRKAKLTLAFSRDVPAHLETRGPFRWVRHPFYAAYLLAYAAGAVISAQPWLLLVLAGMGALYVTAAKVEERKFAQSTLAREYAAYAARTGRFVPRLGRLRTGRWRSARVRRG